MKKKYGYSFTAFLYRIMDEHCFQLELESQKESTQSNAKMSVSYQDAYDIIIKLQGQNEIKSSLMEKLKEFNMTST